MDKIYPTLDQEVKDKIDTSVKSVLDSITIEGDVDITLLMATLEQLNAKKKELKETAEKAKKAIKEEEENAATLRGYQYVKTLNKETDSITFKYGKGGVHTATLPILKVSDKTVRVQYTTDMLPAGSKTPFRNIPFANIVVPEGFEVVEEDKAEIA